MLQATLPFDIQLHLPDELRGGETVAITAHANMRGDASYSSQANFEAVLSQDYSYELIETDVDLCGGFPGFSSNANDGGADCEDYDPPQGQFERVDELLRVGGDGTFEGSLKGTRLTVGEGRIETSDDNLDGELSSSGDADVASGSDLPLVPNSHFTTLVGGTHTAAGSLLSIGGTASPGVEEVAELGGGITLVGEIQDLIDTGHANQSFFGTDLFIEPEETNTFTITVDNVPPGASFAELQFGGAQVDLPLDSIGAPFGCSLLVSPIFFGTI